MSETTAPGPETELSPLEKIDSYLTVLEGTDVEAYRATAGSLNGILGREDVKGLDTTAGYMNAAASQLEQSYKNQTASNFARSRRIRTDAAVHVVQSMSIGLRISPEDFGPIIKNVVSTINTINEFTNDRHAEARLRAGIEILSLGLGETAIPRLRRIAEAYKWVDHPKLRKYGEMAVRAARAERFVYDELHPSR